MLIEAPKVHFHNTDELSRVPDRVSVDISYQSGGYSYVGENQASDLPLTRYWLSEVIQVVTNYYAKVLLRRFKGYQFMV
jgi:hypothetical protein